MHQVVATRIATTLAIAVGSSAYVVGPGAIPVPPGTQLQPDILVYPSRFPPDIDWAKVDEHWLAVEVISRSSRMYDREFKRDAYFALGVHEVWLADLRELSVEVCHVRGAGEVVRETIEWRVPGNEDIARIALADIFQGVRFVES